MARACAFVLKYAAVAALDHLLELRRRLVLLLQLHLILNELLIVLIVAIVSGVHVAADTVTSCTDVGSPL